MVKDSVEGALASLVAGYLFVVLGEDDPVLPYSRAATQD